MPSVQEVLPQAIVSGEATLRQVAKTADLIFFNPRKGDEKCVVKLFSATGRPDVTAWYRIWEAVEAVFAVCVRSRRGGSFMGLGKNRRLLMSRLTCMIGDDFLNKADSLHFTGQAGNIFLTVGGRLQKSNSSHAGISA